MKTKDLLLAALMIPALAACKSAYFNDNDASDATSDIAPVEDIDPTGGQIRDRDQDQTGGNASGAS